MLVRAFGAGTVHPVFAVCLSIAVSVLYVCFIYAFAADGKQAFFSFQTRPESFLLKSFILPRFMVNHLS
jgi:hypothetical protein